MDAHPERLEQLLGGRGIQSPRQVPEEPVAPSLVQAIEGGGIAAHIRVHQRLVGRRFVQVGPRRDLVHPASRPIMDMPHNGMRCVILSRNRLRPSA